MDFSISNVISKMLRKQIEMFNLLFLSSSLKRENSHNYETIAMIFRITGYQFFFFF